MLGLSFNINTLLVIIILGYVLYLIIINNFNYNINQNLEEGFVNVSEKKRLPPSANDEYATNYKSPLTTNVDDICDRKTKGYCLPYELNKIPDTPVIIEPENGEENFKGKNFLFAGFHSQVDNVGVSKTNRKNQPRPEPVNPQVGVNPSSQSTINFDWRKDDQIINIEKVKYEDLIADAWNSIGE
jgi:hypothetical protein